MLYSRMLRQPMGLILQRRSLSSSNSTSGTTQSFTSSSEISHFDELASTWWDPHGPSRILHLMNPLRHDFVASCLDRQTSASSPYLKPQKLRYLDIGCGGGIFAESAARLPYTGSVTAIDPSSQVIAAARKHAATDPDLQDSQILRYIETGLEQFPIPATPDDGVDILTLWEVIEHVDRPADFLRTCMQHVRPGGWLVLSTIARTWPSWLVTKFMAEDILRIVPRGTHDWAKYLEAEELAQFFQKERGWATGEDDLRVEGSVYVPGWGWKFVTRGESWGNYFFGARKAIDCKEPALDL